MTTPASALTFSHVGICVSDLERSLRFYCQGLGFELVESYTVGTEFGRLMEVDGNIVLQSRFITRDGVRIELLCFDAPGFQGQAARRPMNQLGLTHLSVRVEDVDATAARIRELGGTAFDHTRTKLDNPDGSSSDFIYCTDPDGVRIELMRLPG
ncbi:MAG TPA: VOC family protein [Candidatus Binataceae bacterium]|jgi:glyoxylase I family protein|nr:VOC family protein [Candidatus Binataceae bacterium]